MTSIWNDRRTRCALAARLGVTKPVITGAGLLGAIDLVTRRRGETRQAQRHRHAHGQGRAVRRTARRPRRAARAGTEIMSTFDRRLTPARPTSRRPIEKVQATRFAAGRRMQIVAPFADEIRPSPDAGPTRRLCGRSSRSTGRGRLGWGQLEHCVIPMLAICRPCARRMRDRDHASRLCRSGQRLSRREHEAAGRCATASARRSPWSASSDFAKLARGGSVFARHRGGRKVVAVDFAVAESVIGTPYLWAARRLQASTVPALCSFRS